MARKNDDWSGRTIQGRVGRYTIQVALGAGGMATVYRGVDEQGREVAIKVPKEAVLREEGFAARFKREIHSLIKLAHRNVLKVIDVGDADGIPFAVLQYLALGSLRLQQPLDVNDGRPWPMPPEEVAGWLEPIAEALDYVAQQGYVHRDVKPENIMFDAEGNAYLGDFGVIKARADVHRDQPETIATGAGLVLGTPHYMAPEVLMGEPYDGRADQYSLAITVYELLAARLPFPGEAPMAIVGHTTKAPPALAQFVRGLPNELERVVLKGLAKRKEDRFASCRAFARAFVNALPAPQPVAARDSRSVPPPPPPAPNRSPNAPPPVPSRTPASVPKITAVICPYCEFRANLPDNVRSKTIRCAKCHKVYFLEPPDEATRRETKRDTRRKTTTTATKNHGPSVGEIIRIGFKWTFATVLILGMVAGAYFGYGWFNERQANKACKESELACNEADYTRAIERADKAIATDAEYALGYARRGRAKYFLLDTDGAMADFNKAIELDPKLAVAYAYRAAIMLEEEVPDAALNDVDQAIRLNADLGIAHAYRAILLSQKPANISGAVTAADTAVSLDKTNPTVLIARGIVRDRQGKATEARDDIRAATTLPATGAYPWAASSRFYLQRQLPTFTTRPVGNDPASQDQARKDAQEAIRKDSNSVLGHVALAEYYLVTSQEDKARSEAEQVLRLSPKAARGYELLALIELEIPRNLTAAVDALSRGLNQLPDSARLYYTRGIVRRMQRDYDLALRDFNEALRLNPQNAKFYSARAILYRQRGEANDNDLARDDERRADELQERFR